MPASRTAADTEASMALLPATSFRRRCSWSRASLRLRRRMFVREGSVLARTSSRTALREVTAFLISVTSDAIWDWNTSSGWYTVTGTSTGCTGMITSSLTGGWGMSSVNMLAASAGRMVLTFARISVSTPAPFSKNSHTVSSSSLNSTVCFSSTGLGSWISSTTLWISLGRVDSFSGADSKAPVLALGPKASRSKGVFNQRPSLSPTTLLGSTGNSARAITRKLRLDVAAVATQHFLLSNCILG
mmetsp:Transcript_39731/g.88285  ORF Transcript_39731/g.88285 Transcript_39731/m.88285 type:complete len:244 (+) Transcript_39731:342-1073(+)